MYSVDITIVGAGVIGLCVAHALRSSGKTVVVLEKEPGPGRGISSRNSEVIHAGIYYPAGSLKAELCVRGARQLYDFCRKHHVAFNRAGKVIVAASESEERSVKDLFHTGTNNGAEGLCLLTREELASIEPNITGLCALYSPNTGIIDSHHLIKRIEAICLNSGITLLYRSALIGIEKDSHGYTCVTTHADRSSYSFASRVVINAAGLDSDKIAAMAGIDIQSAQYKLFPVKGEYFRVKGGKQRLVNGLVYPSPEKNLTGLGIHATKDLSGALRLGPNAFYVEQLDYRVDENHAHDFFVSAHALLPFLNEDDLMPDMAGIRPKLQKPGGKFRDFVISHEAQRGLPGLVNLIGIESPGLSSCLAVGDYVALMLKGAGLL